MAERWLGKARESMEKRGTVGSFTRAAKRAGKSTQEFAREKAHAPGALGKKARFAKAMGSIARSK